MVALHRAGRKPEALRVYDEARRTLAEELGLEPGATLRRLQLAVLNDDEALAVPARPLPQAAMRRPVMSGPRAWFLSAGGLLLVGAAIAVATISATRDRPSAGIVSVPPNSLAAIDPDTNRVVVQIPAVAGPSSVVFADGDLWVANVDDATVQRVDLDAGRVVNTIPTGSAPIGLAAGDGQVWAIGGDGVVRRIDPLFSKIVARVPTIKAGTLLHGAPVAGALAATNGAVWALSGGSFSAPRLFRIDPGARRARAVLALGDGPTAVTTGFGDLWATDSFDNTVTRIDESGVVIETIPVGRGARAVAVGEGAVWVADSLDDAVVRIDPATNSVTTTIPVGRFPSAVAIGAGAVWVTNRNDGTVSRIDPRTNDAESIKVGAGPAGVVFAAGSVWFTTQESPPSTPVSARDVIRVSAAEEFGTDPALNALPQVSHATCAKLLNYPDAPAPAGTQLVPEVAAALPALSADGRTYTFMIRDGFAFSPPRSSERVTAQTFRHAIERSLSPRTGVGAAQFVSDIAGEDAFLARRTSHISGLVAKGRSLAITLVEPDPSFPTRISMPFFCAVPLDTPSGPDPLRAIPAAGPYYVASEVPGRRIVLKRNPSYHGSRPRRPREIHFMLGSEASEAIDDVIAGKADYALVNPPPERDPELLARYGPASPAAGAGRQQYFVEPTLQFAYLELNTGRPLFSDVRLRRAVNYAIDRRELARLGSWVSGPFQSIPTQQYLPPTLPGASRGVLYPPGGDLRAARRLAPHAHGTALLYTCSDDARLCRRAAELVKANLAPLGLDVDIKEFPYPEQFVRAQRKGEPYDILISHWGIDYPDPSDVLNTLLDRRDLGPELAGSLDRARRLSGQARYAAYRALSVEIAREAAPWVPYAVGSARDLFSARIGCQVFQPVYGMDLGALCTR
jgi:peptide/nickel transport system substrate-binding protein